MLKKFHVLIGLLARDTQHAPQVLRKCKCLLNLLELIPSVLQFYTPCDYLQQKFDSTTLLISTSMSSSNDNQIVRAILFGFAGLKYLAVKKLTAGIFTKYTSNVTGKSNQFRATERVFKSLLDF